jgi:hypothetical protein
MTMNYQCLLPHVTEIKHIQGEIICDYKIDSIIIHLRGMDSNSDLMIGVKIVLLTVVE